MTARTLSDDLRASAARHPEREAIVGGGRRLTFAELDRAADGFAAGLAAVGVRRGDRVAVMLRNGPAAAIAIYGTLRAGAAFAPLNPTARAERLAFLLDHCGAAAVACEPGTQPPHATVIDDVEGFAAAHEPHGPPAVLDVDLASIIYTSGSTGTPKGAAFLHRNMRFVAGSIVEYLGLGGEDRILCVLPLSHTYGLFHLVMAVRIGATLVLEHGMSYPGRIVEALEGERITVLPGVPTVWQVLLSLKGLRERPLPGLRVLTNAGAALSVAQLEQVRQTFPGARLFSMYGQTECARVCFLAPEQLDARPGSVGGAIPGTEVWLEDEQGEEPAPGEVGELLVRGDHVMQGYWRDEAGTAQKLVPGRLPGDRVLRTGDLFRRDAEGFLYFVGRTDDIIKSRGEKIAPKEVEEVLHAADGVREAAVVGVDDPMLGQAVVAHVAAHEGVTLDPRALRRHCAGHLEDFMVPRAVYVHAELPKTDNGKLDKLRLAALPTGPPARGAG